MPASVAMPQCSVTFPDSTEVCIKNTFVYVAEDCVSLPKRSSSLPPSMRLIGIQHNLAQLRKLHSQPPSDIEASTEASDVDTASEVGNSSDGDFASVLGNDVVPQTSEAARLNVSARAWQPRLPDTMAPETHVVTSAEHWTPCICIVPPLPPPTRLFAYQFEQFLTMFKTILSTCLWIDSIAINETSDGFCVVVSVPVQHCFYRARAESIEKLSKAALLQAAERSASMYILGYEAKPFVTMPTGFSAMLAAVPDEHTACWGMLQRGFCHYGNRCRWQHPCDQRRVDVKFSSHSPVKKEAP